MAQFDYVAIAGDGRTLHGRIEAPDQRAAARSLQEVGHLPVEIRPAGEGLAATSARTAGDRPLKARELARVTRGLSLLLTAGMSLDAALEALAGSEPQAAPRALLRALHEGVRSGTSFSAVVASRPGAFPPWYGAAVGAAEGTGRLPEVLDRLAAELLRSARLADRIRAGLTYPAVVLALAVLAVGVLVSVVLPALEPLFTSAGAALPASTQTVLAVAAWLREWGPVALAAVLALGLVLNRVARSEGGRRWRDGQILRLPLIGPIAWRGATARFARALATLLGAGVPLAEAMGHAGAASGNAAVAAGLERARAHLTTGASFAKALAREDALPRLAVTLAGVGEEGGRLREMLEEVAIIHEEDMERATERLLALLVPAVTLVLGGLIAGIVLATLDAILGANSAAMGGQ
jgi:general secretion pathway protein F